MFRKIISNLSFSPALVWQLGHYAKTVRKEEIIRRLGLVFVILSLIVQSLIVFQPPETANASNSNDMVTGGIGSSLDGFLSPYDSNTKHLKDIINYIGITRSEISSAKFGSWEPNDKISWGLLPHFSYDQGERQYTITNPTTDTIAVYSRPLKLSENTNTKILGWSGYSAQIGWFGIEQNNGNIITDKLPSPLPQKCSTSIKSDPQSEACKLCANNDVLLKKDSLCIPNITRSTTATNISQGFVDASSTSAVTSDQISYTITVENTGINDSTITLDDNLSDILEYSTIIDNGGGTLNTTTNVLSWPNIILASKSKQTRTFVIQVLSEIPATAQGSSNPVSYDCVITNTFGNSTNINIDCPIQKTAERIIKSLPNMGIMENIIFACVILFVAIYFHARSRQAKREIRLIRKSTSTGTI